MTQENKTLTETTFLDRTNTLRKLADVVTEKECWYMDKEKRWVLAHAAIQKIAAIAGISKNYSVEESATVQPSYKNELEHIVRVTIKCTAKARKNSVGCYHDSIDDTLTVTGEANKLNTPVRGRGYLRKMAEKRAFDVAVLEHVGIYDTTFSEEESESMLGKSVSAYQSIEISNVDIEALRDEINLLVGCDTATKLSNAGVVIAERIKAKKYTDAQLKYVTHLLGDRKASITGAALPDDEDKPF